MENLPLYLSTMGGVEGITKDLKRMLSEHFSQHLDLQHYQSYAQNIPSQQQSITSEGDEKNKHSKQTSWDI